MKRDRGMLAREEEQVLPTTEEIEAEYDRVVYKARLQRSIQSTIRLLIVIAAAAILIAVLLLPVLRIYGTSMGSTLQGGDIVLSIRGSECSRGDIIAFYYNNNILVKRVIAESGDWVNMDPDGTVYVNNEKIEESYLTDKSYGQTNIELPYQVPDGKVFVMGDNRSVSVDSRNTSIGCVSSEQIVGRVFFRIWPLKRVKAIR